MKLSKLYSNNPDEFRPITFVDGLNVIMAEVRVSKNFGKDTHNLGKTILGRLLDFMFLLGKNSDFFLFKHNELFKKFVFFLEIKIDDGSFVTIRRSVDNATKISFKKHDIEKQDFTNLPEKNWDHYDIPFDKSRELLNSILDWSAFSPYDFRKGIGYLLRSQDDFINVFQLQKFKGKHVSWKPFLAHILGFNSVLVEELYSKEQEIVDKEKIIDTIKKESVLKNEDINKIEGLIQIKRKDYERKQNLIDKFDFENRDKEKTKILVEELDTNIAILNEERYSLRKNEKRIKISLQEDTILFNPKDAEALFKEVNVLFPEQIKKDFEQLISFNEAITNERISYLKEDLEEVQKRIIDINKDLHDLGKQRSETLSFLSETDIFDKYKKATDELFIVRAEIVSLENKKQSITRLQKLKEDISKIKKEKLAIQEKIEMDVNEKNSDTQSLFSTIRGFFSDIIQDVIGCQALLSVTTNQLGHLDFNAEILDDQDTKTSADLGHTYRKLLCVAFDFSVLRAHIHDRYPRFTYHDGIFESLDDRKKINLLKTVRYYAEQGLQPIITLIDADLPKMPSGEKLFEKEEIILTLHDQDKSGRLFKMDSW
ncbi:MAG: DUF2326 domain-containing protein [Zymomonas mobilis]|uniref:DUF2326 domain-containing protein n=1 Tax=Zymomonas mobilis TaxID=542 RepID=UPI0039E93DEB